MKVALFLWFWAFWTLKSVFVKSWLWGLGAPPVFNWLTSNQAQIGSFSHLYQPWDPGQNIFELSCPIKYPTTVSTYMELVYCSKTLMRKICDIVNWYVQQQAINLCALWWYISLVLSFAPICPFLVQFGLNPEWRNVALHFRQIISFGGFI